MAPKATFYKANSDPGAVKIGSVAAHGETQVNQSCN
jgi:hypothetical protein